MRHARALSASPFPPDQKDIFVAKLAHELRQPIGAILTAITVMREHGDAAERARAVIERQARLLRRLVDDLLDVTRVAQGKLDLRKERFDARDVCRKSHRRWSRCFNRAGSASR
jgi:signal transduction histidine kinase